MFEYDLFLAFPVNSEYRSNLDLVPEGIRSLFIQNKNKDYLQSFDHEGQSYLGKNLGSLVDLRDLDSAYSNLISLLQRLIPDVPYEHKDIQLLAIQVAS
jgi:hypothetical protein